MKALPLFFAACLAAASALAADLASLVPAGPRIPDREFSATDLGVVPTLDTPVTAALQKAIDHVDAAGGGKLVIAPGDYVVGPLRLASKLDLHLSAGAVLTVAALSNSEPAKK